MNAILSGVIYKLGWIDPFGAWIENMWNSLRDLVPWKFGTWKGFAVEGKLTINLEGNFGLFIQNILMFLNNLHFRTEMLTLYLITAFFQPCFWNIASAFLRLLHLTRKMPLVISTKDDTVDILVFPRWCNYFTPMRCINTQQSIKYGTDTVLG